MGAFEYQALDANGQTQKGVLQGDTARAVRQLLRERGLNAYAVNEVAEGRDHASFWQRRGLSRAQLALLTRQMATLLAAGLPIDEALSALSEESEEERVRTLLAGLRSRVLEGSSFAAALAEYPLSFPEIFRASIAAGEQSGRLDEVLERLADYSESRDQLTQKIWTAIAYPLLLTLVAIAVVSGLLVYVVPQIVGVFSQLHQTLPLPTRALIGLSDFVKAFGWVLLVGLLVAGFGARFALHQERVRYTWHQWLLRLPLIGRLTRAANTARCARTLALLTASAVPLLESLAVAAQVVPNLPMRAALKRAAITVREGGAFAKALADSGYFPPVAVRLIASGERSGQLERMLEQAADHQQRDLDRWLSVVTAVLGPVVILLVGAMVLFIVLAILLPIFNLNQLVK